MSWLFSQALVAEYSADTSLAGELCAPSSGSPTQLAYWSHGKTTEFSRLSRFGMTCRPLTDAHGEALLTSFLAASRARTSALPELAWALQGGVEVACGAKWPASSVRFDPASSSWKTAHCLWEEDLPSSSVILPRWGMTRSGFVFQHPTSERPISATASGLWATPSATDGRRGGTLTENMTGTSLAQQINTPDRWPTPTVCGNYNRKGASSKSGDGLETAVKAWPTPTASLGTKGGRITPRKGREGGTLIEAVSARTFPTPTASQHKGWSKNHNRADSDDRIDYTIEREAHEAGTPGRLNPAWVEWLMGWPLGWTDLKPLAMDRFREWQRQHSPCCQAYREAA
jgi:hypothetical protein